MPWDRERYRREILDPARQSGRIPADLFIRYGFTAQLPGDAAFRSQIKQVVDLWRSLRLKPGWRKLTDALLASTPNWTAPRI